MNNRPTHEQSKERITLHYANRMHPMNPIGEIVEQLLNDTNEYEMHLAIEAISELKSLGIANVSLIEGEDAFILTSKLGVRLNLKFSQIRSQDDKSILFAKLQQVALFKSKLLAYKSKTIEIEAPGLRAGSSRESFYNFKPADTKMLHDMLRELQELMIDPNFYEQIQLARSELQILKGKTRGEAFVANINDLVSKLSYQVANDDQIIRSTFLNNLSDLCSKYYDHLIMKFYRDGQKPEGMVTPEMLRQKSVPKHEEYLIQKIEIIFQLKALLEKELTPLSVTNSFIGKLKHLSLEEIQQEIKNTINHQPTRDAILQHSKRMTSWFSYTTDPQENEQAWWSLFAIPTESVKFLIGVDREIALIEQRLTRMHGAGYQSYR
jgi:hypothetical protein